MKIMVADRHDGLRPSQTIGILDERWDYTNRECYQLEEINHPGTFISCKKEWCFEITDRYYTLQQEKK